MTHVAHLARLELTGEEVAHFAVQLSAVLEHVESLRRLDIASVPPTSHALELVNVLREDVVRPGLDRDEVLAEAPATEAGRFRVPSILGEAP
ncbi:MAG TPA: Asp-tRNA(Asn)/Glu-tRNA(Gln) amidotransferase subunit GatC [Acidimicrobiales bacterium]|nr:Asp-tRNA(Asn)/Glu-tRNA(Gln) amidotransferase subunit GatC [Acidimicrobiales bacterium]